MCVEDTIRLAECLPNLNSIDTCEANLMTMMLGRSCFTESLSLKSLRVRSVKTIDAFKECPHVLSLTVDTLRPSEGLTCVTIETLKVRDESGRFPLDLVEWPNLKTLSVLKFSPCSLVSERLEILKIETGSVPSFWVLPKLRNARLPNFYTALARGIKVLDIGTYVGSKMLHTESTKKYTAHIRSNALRV